MSLTAILAVNCCGQAMAHGAASAATIKPAVAEQSPAAAQQSPAAAEQSPAAAQQQTANSENFGSKVLHILVGHSIVIHTEARLRRVLVGNSAVITTTTTAPDELVVTASATGSSSVVIWLENNQSQLLEVFADLDVGLLRDAIARTFPKEAIQVEAEEGRVVLTGSVSSQAEADQLAKMAAPFSKDVVDSMRIAPAHRQKQILLKVRFAEVDRTKLNNFGINIFSLGAANTIGNTTTGQFGNTVIGTNSQIGSGAAGTTTATISNLLNIFVFRPDINLGAVVEAMEQKGVAQILAEPDLLAANGEPAKFLSGGELPYPVVSGVAGSSTVTVQFKPFGVKLEFTGIIEDDDTIRLKVYPEVSSLDFTNAVTISGFVLPAIATRHAETVVELRNGQSFGIAGLLDRRVTATYDKVPGLGDIPILGQFFRSRSVNKTNDELMVFVTPLIVDPAAGQTAPAEGPKMPVENIDPKQFDPKVPSGGKQ